MSELLLACLALGAFAGLLAGLLGVGGGLVIVPALLVLFARQGFAPAVLVHLAIGTSLATIVPTSLSSLRAHHRRGGVRWPAFARLSVGIVLGAWLGAAVAHVLPAEVLRRVFAGFVLLAAAQMGLGLRPAPHRALPGPLGLGAGGAVIGWVSAIVGIGGGTLTVPYLAWHNVPLREAVGTSAACGLPIAVAGALGYIAAGWGQPGLPAHATGYVHWPAFAAIAAASVTTAPLGARLTHRLPTHTLKRVFALFLAAVGIRLLLS